eukprot:1682652-Pleurochrysis_carterae.AAC.1
MKRRRNRLVAFSGVVHNNVTCDVQFIQQVRKSGSGVLTRTFFVPARADGAADWPPFLGRRL